MGGKLLPKLNMNGRPIANKYCEGKMKTTARAECKGAEIGWRDFCGVGVAGLACGVSASCGGPAGVRLVRAGGIGALTLNPLGDGQFAGSALDGDMAPYK